PPTLIPHPAEPRTSTTSDIPRHFTCTLTSFPVTASTVGTSKRREHPTPGTTTISRPSAPLLLIRPISGELRWWCAE
ncbi:hypothetical protein B0H34DRAFT_725087, partial [Crassisporium funariophilum]